MLGVPIKLKKTPGEPKRPPPLIGQHTKEILAEIGYSQKEIKELIEAKVVRTSPKELWKAVPPPED
jgi:formyl-CoA transferase